MTRRHYRSEIAIVGDILDVAADAGRDGAMVSSITRSANLSYYAALEKCDKLVEAGLVQLTRSGRNRIFMITEKGLAFVKELEKFQGMANSLNLRC